MQNSSNLGLKTTIPNRSSSSLKNRGIRHRWSWSSAPPCRISPDTIIIARPTDTSSLTGVVVSSLKRSARVTQSAVHLLSEPQIARPEIHLRCFNESPNRPQHARLAGTLFILVVVVLLFGAKKLPELARGLGQSLGNSRRPGMSSSASFAIPRPKSKIKHPPTGSLIKSPPTGSLIGPPESFRA